MKIFWTRFALDSLADIHKYYKNNVSETIAKKNQGKCSFEYKSTKEISSVRTFRKKLVKFK